MNWKELWMTLFGTTEWLGLNIGFWVALAAVLLIVILLRLSLISLKKCGPAPTVLRKMSSTKS